MAGITFTVGSQAFSAVAGGAAGRYAKDCEVSAPREVVIRFHLPGTTGNLKILGGTAGSIIRLVARYAGADAATVRGYMKTDKAAWKATEVSVVDDNGDTHTRCSMRSFSRLNRIHAVGRSIVACDVEMVFDCDSE
jgi:hypothetical protein